MRQYYYLVSSLPMLEFGMKMPFSYEDFLSRCKEHLYKNDMGLVIKPSSESLAGIKGSSGVLKQWLVFDTILKNEFAKARAAKYAKDPAKYIKEAYQDPVIAGFVHWAVKQDNVLETETAIDKFRWEEIEDLQKSHYFDIDFLVCYALKLRILERWARVNALDGMKVLYELIEKE